ncbi:MAG: HAMP domain-containing sensor histidine kinase [Acidobacteriota bacterium]
MKLPLKQRSATRYVVIPSAIVVIALAVLQYRWSARVSEATAVRLADSLQMSLMNWQKDFFRYFSEIALALRIDPLEDAPGDVNQYVRRLAEWKALAKYPNLISGVYILDAQGARVVSAGTRPEEFVALRPDLEKATPRTPTSFGIGDPSAGWLFEPRVPAMLHPIVLDGKSGWLAIELNQREIEDHILGDLSQTYFQGTDGLDYQIAVVSKTVPGHVIYESDKGFGNPEPEDADGVIDVFGRAYDQSLGPAVHVFHAPSEDKGPSASARISWFPLVRNTPENLDWRLVVRHRRGGALGAFVTELHRRDLAIGFGVLLVLALNMGMLIVTSHRAQRLAQLQMNFVTAVSHELRTPLTAIISGAENIRNGVVSGAQQMTQYGSVIENQAKQLYALVERILLFAATRQGRQHYTLRSLDVEELIEASLTSAAELIEASSFTVERDIAPNLPPVLGDPGALATCLQNLITNALKYGKEKSWIGIRAVAKENEVEISVADRGVGIKTSDLPHIFDAFYRSPDVEAAQIHGTGLGLALAKSIAEGMHGRVTVVSKVGEGSTFTLHLKKA